MWKSKQTHEDARKMYRTKILDKKLGKIRKTTIGRSWSGKTGRSPDMAQKVFGIREAQSGNETGELLQTGTGGHQRMWQNVEKNSNSRRWYSPSQGGKKQEVKDKREESQEKSIRGF